MYTFNHKLSELWARSRVTGRVRAGDILPRVTSDQCRAARSFLRWTLDDLAERAGVSRTAIYSFEANRRTPHKATVQAIRHAFEQAGVEFLDNGDGPGLRVKRRG
ncbi:MAG: helix-turn-helix transcriptional regulator [Myxococcales bacterium]|nr:helix-turn-helix transcriptional regulator [Myxococcales bacterium]